MKKEIIDQDGQSTLIDMTVEEVAQFNEASEKSGINALPIIEHQNQINSKLEERRAIYERLGLTAEEAQLLLGGN
jgi:hypothetical protein